MYKHVYNDGINNHSESFLVVNMALEHTHNLGIPSYPSGLQVAIAWNTIMLLCVVLTMYGVKRTPFRRFSRWKCVEWEA